MVPVIAWPVANGSRPTTASSRSSRGRRVPAGCCFAVDATHSVPLRSLPLQASNVASGENATADVAVADVHVTAGPPWRLSPRNSEAVLSCEDRAFKVQIDSTFEPAPPGDRPIFQSGGCPVRRG